MVKKTRSNQEFRTPERTQARLGRLSLNVQSKNAVQLPIWLWRHLNWPGLLGLPPCLRVIHSFALPCM